MVIGLVGESPNDTDSIEVLFKRYFPDKFTYIPLLRHYKGSRLDSKEAKKNLKIEFNDHSPKITIFIRDLDGLEDDREKKLQRQRYFNESNAVVNNTGVFLLSIYELETLVLYDLDTFNTLFTCKAEYKDDPMLKIEPKEFLMAESKFPKYDSSANPDIFSVISQEKTSECRFLKDFFKTFEEKISKSN